MAKSFIKIHPIFLMETLYNKPSFVTVNGAITIMLQFVNPFAAHNILSGRGDTKARVPCL